MTLAQTEGHSLRERVARALLSNLADLHGDHSGRWEDAGETWQIELLAQADAAICTVFDALEAPSREAQLQAMAALVEVVVQKSNAAIRAVFDAIAEPSEGMLYVARGLETHAGVWRAMLAQAKREAGL